MTEVPNTHELLSEIHAKVCKAIALKLENPEDLSAADINAITKLLKDNNITAIPASGSPLGEVVDKASAIQFPFMPDVASNLLPEDDPIVEQSKEVAG